MADAQEQQQQLVDITIPPGHEMVRTGKKETFYTRLNGKQVRDRRAAYG